MAIEAVIFDCDGVLVNSESINIDVEMLILVRYGLEFSREEYIQMFLGHSGDYIHKKLKDLCDERGTRIPDNIFEIFEKHTREIQEQELQPVDGIADVLGQMKLKKAVGTNSNTSGVTFKLGHTGLAKHFNDHVYARDMVANGKPAPDIYLLAASKLSVKPENCVVVEDSVQGVMAGVAAGMTVVGYTGGGHCPDAHDEDLLAAGAAVVIDHMEDLPATITALEVKQVANPPQNQPRLL